ncbi:MAG: nucleotidyltransferase domain-containing protein [Minicystis sp.]
MSLDEHLSPHQRAIMERVIREEQAKRSHLVIALSGAHAYGFPSPDSDLDLKSIHTDPTARVLGLHSGTPHVDRMEVIEGVEIDYTSNELKPVILGILQGNGNYLERVLGPLLPFVSPELAELRPLVERSLSKRLFRHYLGFATSQLKAFQADGGGSAKKLLYVLRTALTGAHALRTGTIVTDLQALLDDHGLPEARALIAEKRAGEKTRLSPELSARWLGEVNRVFTALELAHLRSHLPTEPDTGAALEDWLLSERRKRF